MTMKKHLLRLGVIVGLALMMGPLGTAHAAFTGPVPTAYWYLDDLDPLVAYDDAITVDDVNDAVCDSGNCPADSTLDAVVTVSQTFDGTNDGLLVPFSGSADRVFDWDDEESFSIEVWFKISDDPTNLTGADETEVIIGRFDDSAGTGLALQWWIGVRNVNGEGVRVAARLRDQEGDGDGVLIANTGSNYVTVTDNAWHHAVLVKNNDPDGDPLTPESDVSLYVDGVLEDTQSVDYTVGAGLVGFTSVDTPMSMGFAYTVGSGGDSRNFFFEGGIDQVALYGGALTDDEVEQYYEIGVAGYYLDEEFAPLFPTTDFGFSALGYLFTANVDPIGNPEVTSLSLGTRPEGLTMNASTGAVSWMPTDQQTGLNTFEVSATNTTGTTNEILSVEIVDVCAALQNYWDLDETAAPFDGEVHTEPTHPDTYDASCAGGNCPAQELDPKVGGALSFDGSDDGLLVAASAGADLTFDWSATESFTVEFFMKTDGAGIADNETEVMIGRVLTGTNFPQWWIGLRDESGGGVAPRLYARLEAVNGDGDATPITNDTNPADVTDGLWHHVALVYNQADDTVSLYVDGELEASESIVFDDATNFASATDPLTIGYFNNTFFFQGSLDEIAFVGSALDASILQQHATQNDGRGFCNDAPVITSTAVTDATEGEVYTYDPTADDFEGDTLTWTLSNPPSGMTINSTTGAIEWTPGSAVGGTDVPVTLIVYDDFGGTGEQLFTISVADTSGTGGGGGGGGGGGCFIGSALW